MKHEVKEFTARLTQNVDSGRWLVECNAKIEPGGYWLARSAWHEDLVTAGEFVAAMHYSTEMWAVSLAEGEGTWPQI